MIHYVLYYVFMDDSRPSAPLHSSCLARLQPTVGSPTLFKRLQLNSVLNRAPGEDSPDNLDTPLMPVTTTRVLEVHWKNDCNHEELLV
jgi:hypothetical protein